jgi:PleD family two-component response regulator
MVERQTILIVDDDQTLSEMLREYFDAQGYAVRTADWGVDAVYACWEAQPQLALLDIHLPDITGYEVARRLRSHRRTRDIPLIFLTNRRGREDRLHGLELGAVDYISKPFDLQELQLRVRNALRRVAPPARFHPLTGLPEGSLVDEQLAQMLTQPDGALVSVALRGLARFREAYGFVAADDVLRAVGLRLKEAVGQADARVDFLGQLDAENYLVITRAPHLANLNRDLRAYLSQPMDYFYSLEDREQAPEEPLELRLTEWRAESVAPAGDLDALKTVLRSAR